MALSYVVVSLFHDFFRSIQRYLEVRADIFFSQQFIESGFLQHLIYFLIDSERMTVIFSFCDISQSVVRL